MAGSDQVNPGTLSVPAAVLLAALVTLSPALPLGSGDAPPVPGEAAAPAGGPGALVHYARVALVENAGLDLTHYPVLVPLDTAAPIAEGKMRPDCGDARFTDAATLAPLPYWLEGGCGTAEARFWVLIEDLPRSAVPKPVLVTYGDAALDSASDGAAVLDAYATFDDGTLDGWRDADLPLYGQTSFRGDYPPAVVDAAHGVPGGSVRKGPEGFDGDPGSGNAGVTRTFTIPANVNLAITLDYRARSSFAGSGVTNAFVTVARGPEPVTIEFTGTALAWGWLALDNSLDTGWRRAEPFPVATAGAEAVTVFLGTNDVWASPWNKAVWFDNVAVRRVANPQPTVTVLPETPAPSL